MACVTAHFALLFAAMLLSLSVSCEKLKGFTLSCTSPRFVGCVKNQCMILPKNYDEVHEDTCMTCMPFLKQAIKNKA